MTSFTSECFRIVFLASHKSQSSFICIKLLSYSSSPDWFLHQPGAEVVLFWVMFKQIPPTDKRKFSQISLQLSHLMDKNKHNR